MSIVTRTVLLTAAIAAIAVFVAGLVSYPLLNSAAESQARGELVGLADLTATALDRDPGDGREAEPLPHPLIEALRARQITGFIAAKGSALPPGVSAEMAIAVLGGESISAEGVTPTGQVLIEGRPLVGGGALFLEQPYTVVGGEASDGLHRIALALLLGLLIAVPIGVWAARRLTRPLRAARDAANEMADGSRSVTLRPEGPVEIADIAVSLNRLNAALVVSEGRQREFLLSVSHELRTPLTAVKGYAEALADNVIPPEDVARTGAIVSAEAARLDRLVRDLLDLARLGAVDFHIAPVDVDLVEIGEDAGAVWVDRATPEGVRFVLELSGQPVMVRTDPIRVRQVIDNLAENALRVSPPDTVIVLAVRREADWGVVEVRDSGPGLTLDDVGVAFEPGVLHERYRGVRPVGTGLGLALVGKLAQSLGGSAEAGEAAEGGARFTVRLPV
jgi:two-component system sensor histidine kinase BaeS